MIKNRNKHKAIKSSGWDRIPMEWSSHLMLILHAAYTLSLLRNYKTFGRTPECNGAARVFLFGTHTLTDGWFIGWGIAYAIALSFGFFLLLKTLIPRKPINELEEEQKVAAKPKGDHTEQLVCYFPSSSFTLL